MEEYQELGLTNNEGKVYEILVEFGKLGAGEISSQSGVSYSKIYNVLSSLINKGLVEIVPEKTKKFVPSSPDSLIKLIEKKQEKLEKVKEEVKEMKKFYEVKEKNPVVMEIGRKGFYKIVNELKKTEKYDYSIKWTSEYRPDWARQTAQKIKRKCDIRNLVRYDKETEKNVGKWLRINKNIRKFENEGIAFSVIDDEEIMISLIKANVTLLIKNVPFAKIMKKLFLDSYEKAEKIK